MLLLLLCYSSYEDWCRELIVRVATQSLFSIQYMADILWGIERGIVELTNNLLYILTKWKHQCKYVLYKNNLWINKWYIIIAHFFFLTWNIHVTNQCVIILNSISNQGYLTGSKRKYLPELYISFYSSEFASCSEKHSHQGLGRPGF